MEAESAEQESAVGNSFFFVVEISGQFRNKMEIASFVAFKVFDFWVCWNFARAQNESFIAPEFDNPLPGTTCPPKTLPDRCGGPGSGRSSAGLSELFAKVCGNFTKIVDCLLVNRFVAKMLSFGAVQKCVNIVELGRMQQNAYFLAKIGFDIAENEPAKKLQNLQNQNCCWRAPARAGAVLWSKKRTRC